MHVHRSAGRYMCGEETGLPETESRLLSLMVGILRSIRTPTLREIEESDGILILGEDLTNFAPRVALSVRQSVRQRQFEIASHLKIPLWQDHGVRDAAQNARSLLIIASPYATKLDDIATAIHRAAPAEIAALAQSIAAPLADAKRPIVISGAGLNSEAMLQAAAKIAVAHNASLYLAAPECNSLGAALLGGKPLSAIDGSIDTAIVAENDLSRRAFVDPRLRIIALDFLPTPTTARAELVLPAATFAESEGTFINNEARAQRFFRALPPDGDVRESWRWLGDWPNLDEILHAIAREFPSLEPVLRAARAFPNRRRENSARPASLQRTHRHPRRRQCLRTRPTGRSRFRSRLQHGRRADPTAARAHSVLLVARLEFDSVDQFLPGVATVIAGLAPFVRGGLGSERAV